MNPYLTVGSPNYAAPLLNFGQQGQQGQGQNNQQQRNSQQLGQQYAQILQRLLGGGNQPGMPMNISPGNLGAMQPGNIGGTSPFGGSAGAIY